MNDRKTGAYSLTIRLMGSQTLIELPNIEHPAADIGPRPGETRVWNFFECEESGEAWVQLELRAQLK